jgi:hypothetical protein
VTNVSVASTVGGLEPATTYHFRLVAENANGVALGGDRSFTTDPNPAPPSQGGGGGSGDGGSGGGGSTGGGGNPSGSAETTPVDDDPPGLTSAIPDEITKRQLVYGFRLRGGCDEPCSLRFEERAPQGSGLRQAGYNYVLARAALPSGSGTRSVVIRPCVRGASSRARTLRCRRELFRALARRGSLRVLVRIAATDAAGNRTRQRQTVEVR